jgi:hypothetical protein
MYPNTMVINFVFIWFVLCLIGIVLIHFRTDSNKILRDFWFIVEHGKIGVQFFMYVAIFLILPFSIFYSIRNILNK